MTTIKHNAKSQSLKQEVRQIREAAQKVTANKASAKRFLVSAGIYTSGGQLKSQFR